MENPVEQKIPAGFWIRLAATCTDLLIVWAVVRITAELLHSFGIYVPLELAFIISYLIYSSLFIGWKKRTIGKVIFGLIVSSPKDKSIGYFNAFLRETVCKFLSAAGLFLGFIWIAFTRNKRGWHDYIVTTQVIREPKAVKYIKVKFTVVFLLMILFFAREPLANIRLVYLANRSMKPSSSVAMPYATRDPSSLIEISSLTEDNYAEFIKWLEQNGKDPVEYAVETASKHLITIFGEAHETKDYLVYLNKIIPELYYRAGVTCVAMEVCLEEDNEKINKLVMSSEFDPNLAMEIARHQPWGIWGSKEYWDVFETVWKLNQEIPSGRKKMRLVGIDTKWDGPSMGLVTGGENAKIKAPVWEKLRILRILDDVLVQIKRDEVMARNVEKEIIEKKERGIVWIGYNHSFTHYQQPIFLRGQLVKVWDRMGVILHRKYGDEIFQVVFHQYFDSVMRDFIERIMEKRKHVPVAFDVSGNSFGSLRDNRSEDYKYWPGLEFSDKVCGYVYLKPITELSRCQWLEGYISEKMFVTNKPYYKAWADLVKMKANNTQEANNALKILFESP